MTMTQTVFSCSTLDIDFINALTSMTMMIDKSINK